MIEGGGGLLAKACGVVAGTALALVFNPPPTRAEFARRSFVSVVFGAVFGPVILWKFELPRDTDTIVAAFAAAAFLSWWLLGAARTAVDKVQAKREK